MEEREISKAVVKRLPRYYRYLGNLLEEKVERISSGELSRLMNVTASQIRQDLNNFGGFGQQGYGYNVKYLYQEIGKILGLDKTYNMLHELVLRHQIRCQVFALSMHLKIQQAHNLRTYILDE